MAAKVCIISTYFQMVKLEQPGNASKYNFKAIFCRSEGKHRRKILSYITTTKETYQRPPDLWNGSRLHMNPYNPNNFSEYFPSLGFWTSLLQCSLSPLKESHFTSVEVMLGVMTNCDNHGSKSSSRNNQGSSGGTLPALGNCLIRPGDKQMTSGGPTDRHLCPFNSMPPLSSASP